MAFRTNAAPYQRAKKSTLQIMLILLAALIVVWGFGIAYSFTLQNNVNEFVNAYNAIADAFNLKNATGIDKGVIEAMPLYDTVNYGVKSILMVIVAVAVTAACDVVTTLIRHKKDSKQSLGQEIVHDLIHNYSWITAIIFALCLPVFTPYYVIIVGSIFATVVVKNFFGGFGRNIFNPAIMARIFVGMCFASVGQIPEILKLASVGITELAGIGGGAGIDVVTGATLTTAYNTTNAWLSTSMNTSTSVIFGNIFTDFGMKEMLFGQYLGTLGETFTIVILVLGVALSVLKVINWRTPVFYLGTVALTSLVIALVLGFENPFNYVLYHLALGGVMFGAVFMLTDPVTGPTSPFGKSLAAVIAGLLTVVIRVKSGGAEGVMYSIAVCNLISPAIDYFTVGKSNSNLVKKCCAVFGTLLVSVGLCTGLAWNVNGGREVYAINNINAGEYNTLESLFTLEEGHEFAVAEGYTITNTENIKDFVLDKESGESLDAVYFIVDENGNKVATVYFVTGDGIVNNHYQDITVKGSAMVAVNTDGSLYGFSVLSNLCTTNKNGPFVTIDRANEYGNGLKGKDLSNLGQEDLLAGATYTGKIIANFVQIAYDEYNSSNGGNA